MDQDGSRWIKIMSDHVLQEFCTACHASKTQIDTKIDFDRETSLTVATVRLTSTEKRKLKTPRGPASQLSAPALQQFAIGAIHMMQA